MAKKIQEISLMRSFIKQCISYSLKKVTSIFAITTSPSNKLTKGCSHNHENSPWTSNLPFSGGTVLQKIMLSQKTNLINRKLNSEIKLTWVVTLEILPSDTPII